MVTAYGKREADRGWTDRVVASSKDKYELRFYNVEKYVHLATCSTLARAYLAVCEFSVGTKRRRTRPAASETCGISDLLFSCGTPVFRIVSHCSALPTSGLPSACVCDGGLAGEP